MRRISMVGKLYGFLTIISEQGKRAEARCQCGTIKIYLRSNILAGYTQSCGCFQKQQTSTANRTHGQAGSRAYISWKAMKQRCNNLLKDHAQNYIERGITYDPSWENFEQFFTDMGERPEGTELDRKDNSKGYYKENCRWTTHKINCNNRG